LKKKLCVVDNCESKPGEDKIFCDKHWAFLPFSLRAKFMAEYNPGLFNGKNQSPYWKALLADAVNFIESYRKWL